MRYFLALIGVACVIIAKVLDTGVPIVIFGLNSIALLVAYWIIVRFASFKVSNITARLSNFPDEFPQENYSLNQEGLGLEVLVSENPSRFTPRVVLWQDISRPFLGNYKYFQMLKKMKSEANEIPVYRIFGKYGPLYLLPDVDLLNMGAGMLFSIFVILLGWIY